MDRVACCARPCSRTASLDRAAKRGDVEWICDEHWVMIPKDIRHAYLSARGSGSDQLGGAIWEWARCRQAAINAENAERWTIVRPEPVCEYRERPAPSEGGRETR